MNFYLMSYDGSVVDINLNIINFVIKMHNLLGPHIGQWLEGGRLCTHAGILGLLTYNSSFSCISRSRDVISPAHILQILSFEFHFKDFDLMDFNFQILKKKLYS